MISVILTAFNAQDYIQQAIESIINQTYTDWELIIVDDASTDKTRDKIGEFVYSERENEIIFDCNIENKGHTKSLNNALELSQYPYIAWQDADDISEPTRFEEQLKCFKDNIGIVTTHGISIDKDGKRVKDWYTDKAQRRTQLEISMNAETDWWVMGPSMMFKREVVDKIGGFDEECYYAQDFNFWLRAKNYFGWNKCEQELYRLRRHKSVRSNPKAKERNWHTHAWERAKKCPNL